LKSILPKLTTWMWP